MTVPVLIFGGAVSGLRENWAGRGSKASDYTPPWNYDVYATALCALGYRSAGEARYSSCLFASQKREMDCRISASSAQKAGVIFVTGVLVLILAAL